MTEFVDRHPTVIILCLGFLLMIGLSLILEGLGYHIPKGYLYAAIGFSIVVEAFNQLALRNRRNRITTRGLRESAARAVLELLGGTTIPGGETEMEMAALATPIAGTRCSGRKSGPLSRGSSVLAGGPCGTL